MMPISIALLFLVWLLNTVFLAYVLTSMAGFTGLVAIAVGLVIVLVLFGSGWAVKNWMVK